MPTPMKQKEYEDAGGQGTGETWSAPLDGTLISEDWMHQHPTEHQMQAQGKRRRIVRSNDPKRDTQPVVQAGTGTNATTPSSPNHAGSTTTQRRSTRRPRKSNFRALHVARANNARKQYSTQRSDGPRPSTPQLLMLPFVVCVPHVTEAAPRHHQPKPRRTKSRVTPIAFPTYGRLKDETQ